MPLAKPALETRAVEQQSREVRSSFISYIVYISFGGKYALRVLLPRLTTRPPEQRADREVDVAADRGPAARPHVEGPRDVRQRGLLRGPGPEHGRGVGSVAVAPVQRRL